MQKTLILSTCLIASLLGTAQTSRQYPVRKTAQVRQGSADGPTHHSADRAVVWSDDFSQPSTWTIDHAPGSFNLDWEIGVGLQNSGEFPTEPIESTTASNGYAMLDSDGAANTSGIEESARMTTANPIDLSGSANVILEFENNYRKFPPEACYVVVSTDGTFPNLTTSTDISSLPNVFRLFGNLATNTGTTNPEVVSLDISSIAGGQSTVWIRFHWTGSFAYSWFVDDVSIIDQEPFDLKMDFSFISHTGTGEEYARVPQNQLNSTMNMGGQVTNFGSDDQTGLVLEISVSDPGSNEVFNGTFPLGDLASGASVEIDEMITLPTLAEGIHEATFTITSDQFVSEANTDNNTIVRQFSIDNDVYALDGLDVYDENLLTAMGSNSFAGAADGLEIMTYYELAAPAMVYGVSAELANGTEVNSAVIVSIHDTANVFADNMNNPLAQSDVITVTTADLAAGRVLGLFSPAVSLPAGGYYASVRLFSTGNQNEILILDDITVPQPTSASLIYDPSDNQVFANGNASAVRLQLSPSVGLSESNTLQGLSVLPNPSQGACTVRSPYPGPHRLEVVDLLGTTVWSSRFMGSTTVDLSNVAKGVYMVKVSSEQGSFAQRLVLE